MDSTNTKISGCLGINVRIVQKIWRVQWWLWRYVLTSKELLILWVRIQAITSVARNIGVTEFLIRQVVHDDIQQFSYKIVYGWWDVEKDHLLLWWDPSYNSVMLFGPQNSLRIESLLKNYKKETLNWYLIGKKYCVKKDWGRSS